MQTPANECPSLENYRVAGVPTIFYVPNFVSAEEESDLLRQVYSAPRVKWKAVAGRRLQNWGGLVSSKGLFAQPLPTWLARWGEVISQRTRLFPAAVNHVLVNEYRRGSGILPHQDGPAYHPVVAILSLGGLPAVVRFSPHMRLGEVARDAAQSRDGEAFGERVPEEAGRQPGGIMAARPAAVQTTSDAETRKALSSPHDDSNHCQERWKSAVASGTMAQVNGHGMTGGDGETPLQNWLPGHLQRRGGEEAVLRESEGCSSSVCQAAEATLGSGRNRHTDVSFQVVPRSLLIFKDAAYTDYLHSIEIEPGTEQLCTSCSNDVNFLDVRVSFTFRHVSKISKSLFKLGH